MSGPQPGFLATYNSLKDKHLVGYFSNARIRRHLQRSGLISRSGRIIPEKEYQLNAMRRDHQRYVQECLARAIFHKVLDMEHHHQLEIKRKLENSVRKERVQKIKVEQSRRLVEGASPMHAPHPPRGPRNRSGRHPLAAGEPAGHSQLRAPGPVVDYSGGHPHQRRSKEPAFPKMTSWRPNTAPGNMQHPVRLQPLRSCPAVGLVPKTSSSKQKCHTLDNDQQLASAGERNRLRLMNSMEYVTGVSPYQLPVISNYVIPAPPPPLQKGDKSINAVRNGMPRGRRYRPTTAPNGLEQLLTKNSGGLPKPSLRSNALVTMVFLGKSVHLSHDDADYRDEIKVYQQHCGGENLCVYKGKLLEGETFQFISKRHRGFPFSLTFFLNGIQVDRLSCCCEYKHQKRSRLGGRHRYFGFLNVEGASPCYRCIIAMGLDKKPSPPKKKVEDQKEKHVGSWRDGVHSEPSKSSVEQKSSKESVLVILPIHETSVETIEDKVETGQEYGKEERKKLSVHESEDSQEDTGKNEYDEDFEADEDVNEEGQTGDQMNGMSKSFSDDKEPNSDYEKKSTNSAQNVLPASDSEKDESDGYSESDSEDDKQGELNKGNAAVCEKVAAARKIQSFYRKYKIQQEFKPADSQALAVCDDQVKVCGYQGVQRWKGTEGRPAHSLSSISTQYSSEDDSHAEKMEDNVKGEEEYNANRASDNTAHARCGNENGEKKLLSMEENQETFALEKEGIDEAEKAKPGGLTAREDTGIFHENIMAMQHQSPEVSRELEEAGSVESNIGEDGEKNASARRDGGAESLLVPLESDVMEVEDSSEECAQSDGGGAPDGAFLAEGTGTLDVQKAAEQVVREGQVVGERRALEMEGFAAEGGDACTKEAEEAASRAGDLLPREDTEGQREVEEPAPEESAMAGGDPQGEGTGKEMKSGTEVALRKHKVLREGRESGAVLGERAPGGEELAQGGSGAVSEREKVAGEVSGGEDAVEEASEGEAAVGATGPLVEEVVGEMVSEAEEAMEEGGSAGTGVAVGAASEGEEAVEDASLAEEGIARVAGPEGEEAVEETTSEGEAAVEKPGALLETLGDASDCTGEAVPGEDDFVKPSEFSQLKASGEEQTEVEKAAIGAALSETGEATEVEGSALLRAEDAVEESANPGKGPVLPLAPGLEAPVDAGGDPVSEGSSWVEETTAVEEEEGSAGALVSGGPSPGSTTETGSATAGTPAGGETGGPAETARAEPGGAEGGTGGAARPGGAAGQPALPALWLCVSRAAEAGRAGAGEGAAGAEGGGQSGADGVSAQAAAAGGHGDAGGGAAGCGRGAQREAALGAAGAGAGGGTDGLQEGTERAGVRAERQQPGLREHTRGREAAAVPESAGSDAGERRTHGPVGGSPEAPRAAGVGERSRGPRPGVASPDVAGPLVQPRDGEEALP